MINFEYYKVFYYACKYMNFTKAAAALGTSQSSVSHIMQTLEYQLGCRLFSRSNRGIKLTPDGEALYYYVNAGCEQFIKGENELISGNTAKSGVVYLAATETALHCFLFDALNRFNAIYPDIRFKIENLTTFEAVNAVKNSSSDYAVLSTPLDIEKPLVEIRLVAFSDVLICGERFKSLSGRLVSLSELSEYPYISLFKGTTTRAFFDEFFNKNNLSITPDTEVATTDMLIPMVKNNIGIGFAPSIMPELNDNGIYKAELNTTPPERSISLVSNTCTPKSPAAKQFYKFISECKK